MAFVPASNVAMAEMRMVLDDQKIENTLYFHESGGLTPTIMTNIGNDLLDWWTGHYAGLVTSQVTLREIVITDLSTATSGQSTIPGGGAPGTDNVNAMPSNVALTVSFRTAFRGRSFRGRNYISGISNDQRIGPNELDSSYLTAVATAYNHLKVDIDGGDAVWSIVSRFSGVTTAGHPIPRTAAVVTPITTVVIVDRVLDSMRRRLPGRGQ